MERTPTAQIEFWAKLGRVMEAVLSHESVVAVKGMARVDNINEVLALVSSPEGKERALAEIARNKGPVYSTDPAAPGVIIATLPDGAQRRGKFVNRRFVEIVVVDRRHVG